LGESKVKFCPNCGAELPFQQAKFCSECGFSLVGYAAEEDVPEKSHGNQTQTSEALVISISELGKKLEEVVEKIFISRGYSTQRRQRIIGESGTRSEIDIIAQKGNKKIAIECKNYSHAAGIEKVRDFSEKLRDLELDGVFIALNGLTWEAEQFAASRHIETMDSGELMEKWWAISVGRGESIKGQSLSLEYALPLNVSFVQATKINLLNKEKVRVSDVELIFHPYFFAEYIFQAQFRDPTKELHDFQDSDILFVDALDGKVLNPFPEKGYGIITAIKKMSSSSFRAENARTQNLLLELRNKSPSTRYDIQITEDYRASKLKPAISLKQALQAAIDFIMQTHTYEIEYTTKDGEDHSITYVPKRSEIRILRKDVVIVPRWSIEFEAFNKGYRREVLACSGFILEDTMLYCPNHFQIGAFRFSKKQAIAVCEVCGQSLCEDHVQLCPICNKWLCEEDGIECAICRKRFCHEHRLLTCPICGAPICNSCAEVCPICHVTYGANHAVVCDQCKQTVCPNCIVTTGFIRKSRTCKRCVQT
jgi:hypothetical protein